jgi:hypothetical protein
MSVNGKPFKPDPTSFSMTGLSCGDPQRYKTRGVIRTTWDSTPFEALQEGIPGIGTESKAEKDLKRLLTKQMDTNHVQIEFVKLFNFF